jgi:hypothetical protein
MGWVVPDVLKESGAFVFTASQASGLQTLASLLWEHQICGDSHRTLCDAVSLSKSFQMFIRFVLLAFSRVERFLCCLPLGNEGPIILWNFWNQWHVFTSKKTRIKCEISVVWHLIVNYDIQNEMIEVWNLYSFTLYCVILQIFAYIYIFKSHNVSNQIASLYSTFITVKVSSQKWMNCWQECGKRHFHDTFLCPEAKSFIEEWNEVLMLTAICGVNAR